MLKKIESAEQMNIQITDVALHEMYTYFGKSRVISDFLMPKLEHVKCLIFSKVF